MNSALGMAELPLTILLWAGVVGLGLAVVLSVIVVIAGGISDYKKHKDQIKWSRVTRGLR
jgi:hypothetical protein